MNKDRITPLYVILVSLMAGCVHFATERIIFYLSNARFDNLDKQLIYGGLILFIIIFIFSIYGIFRLKQLGKKSGLFTLTMILVGITVSIEGLRVLFGLLY
jgi:hypothetical protein